MSASEIDVGSKRGRRIEVHELTHFLPHRGEVIFVTRHLEIIHIHAEEQLFLFVYIEAFPGGNGFEAEAPKVFRAELLPVQTR